MDMARVERPVIWDGMFNLWIGEVIVFTHSDKQFLDGMAGRINSALSGMVERSVVDGLVEALRTLKKDSALGMGEKWVSACEKADTAIAAFESSTGDSKP